MGEPQDSSSDVLYELKGAVGWLTINRPQRRNALRTATIEAALDILDRAAADQAVRVLCLTGKGDKVFCAGADLGRAPDKKTAVEGASRYARLIKVMVAYPKPLVARVNGHCVGGGVGLMSACDLAYAPKEALIGTPEVNVGLFPMMVGALLAEIGVPKKLNELIYTGQMVGAAEAAEIGLLTRAYPAEDFDEAVGKILSTIASKAPLALSAGRQALAEARRMDFDAAIDHLAERFAKLLATEDAAEGVAAFAEKRPPRWRGR